MSQQLRNLLNGGVWRAMKIEKVPRLRKRWNHSSAPTNGATGDGRHAELPCCGERKKLIFLMTNSLNKFM